MFSVIWVAIDVKKFYGEYAKYPLETQQSNIIK